ncbi:hypothetical protein K1T71_006552 [Dendrolimus kikuchii]|uniref:Uncharacterized protein n=1 Tax=Dendrolimus kikuchii TaxID=765133 RepID=A0ACC1D149_9NEOP|nr:hypothetical protein K1T71_006552 [Dendrolimus kikuchii]
MSKGSYSGIEKHIMRRHPLYYETVMKSIQVETICHLTRHENYGNTITKTYEDSNIITDGSIGALEHLHGSDKVAKRNHEDTGFESLIKADPEYEAKEQILHVQSAMGNETPTFTMSRFGKPAIQVGKYRFNKNNRSQGPKTLWVCGRVSSGCRATITTFDDIIIKQKTLHNH